MIFARSKWLCASLKFVGMVGDRQGVRSAKVKIEVVAELSRPTTVEALRAFLVMTGYVRQVVEQPGVLAAPLNILHNKAFACKRSQRSLIPWLKLHQNDFPILTSALKSFLHVAFPIRDIKCVLLIRYQR